MSENQDLKAAAVLSYVHRILQLPGDEEIRARWKERQMPTVEVLSHDDIVRRKAELLASVGASEDELRERAASYMLNPREAGILSEIDGMEFLLGE